MAIAEALDARGRADRQAEACARRASRARLAEAAAWSEELGSLAALLAASSLLAAGFHRPPNRGPWRR